MALIRTSYMYGGFLEYYFRLQCSAFGVCMIKLRHERMIILRCISFPKKTELPPEKKLPPPPATTLTRSSSHWES